MFEMDDEKSNSFSRCCQAIVQAFKRKIIQSKDDLVGILLYNTRDSQNALSHKYIYVLSEPTVPSAKLIKRVRDLPLNVEEEVGALSDDTQCDFRELLWTLQNIFSTMYVKKIQFHTNPTHCLHSPFIRTIFVLRKDIRIFAIFFLSLLFFFILF